MTATTNPIRVLHVDDEPELADLASVYLEREDDRISVRTVTTPEEGLDALASEEIDCVVSDYDMPGTNGIEFLEAVREEYPDLPFILYTGKGSEAIASDAVSAGVTDYLQKEGGTSQYTVLANRITNAVEQYRSTRALEASQKRLSLFFEQSPLGVIEWTEDFEFARVNEAAEEILGYDESELLGEPGETIVSEPEREEVGGVVDNLLDRSGGYHSINENVRKDGERIICEWYNRVVTDSEGEVVAIFSQFQDITERRTRQRELERHREVLQAANNTIITVDGSTVVQSVNAAVEETFGYSPDELVGEPMTTLMSDDVAERFRAAFERYLETGEKTLDWDSTEFEGQHRDGSPVPVSVTFGEVVHEGERLFVGILRDISDRKARKAELRRKERRYGAVFNDPNILVGLLDTDGTVLDVNETAAEYIDVPPAAVTGEPFPESPWFSNSSMRQADVREWIERAADGEYVEFEADHTDADGELFTVEGMLRPVTDDDGEVVSLLVSSRDVTEQKERERELEWTNAVFSTLLETLPVGVLAGDESREILAANNRLLELFGLAESSADVVGADCEGFVEDVSDQFADSEAFVDRTEEIVAGDSVVHGEDLHREDGRTFARSHEPIELPDGNGHLWTYRDVTAQRAYEGQLEALNEMAQALITADSRERVADTGVNAARDVLGMDANAIHLADDDRSALVPVSATDSLYHLVGEPPTFTEGDSIAWRVYEDGEALAVDDTHEDPDVYNPDSPLRSELHLPLGEYGVLIAGSPTPDTFDQKDLVLGQILAGSIVSALEQIEQMEQRRARERDLSAQNERLEEFASIVSHDLRNPLNVAEGQLELAREQRDWDQLAAVERAHERMNDLIDDLLTLAREGDHVSEIEPVDLGSLAGACWENVATDEATLRVETDRTIRADRSPLQQLLENLMRNSVEHGGNDVTVSVGDSDDGFYVADDGPGVPVGERDQVFEAGYSTNDRGTGFGLSIVKEIIEAHGWEISVGESADDGARFEITGVAFAAE